MPAPTLSHFSLLTSHFKGVRGVSADSEPVRGGLRDLHPAGGGRGAAGGAAALRPRAQGTDAQDAVEPRGRRGGAGQRGGGRAGGGAQRGGGAARRGAGECPAGAGGGGAWQRRGGGAPD